MLTRNALLSAVRCGATTSSEIAESCAVSRNRVSVALYRLANLGFVERCGVAALGLRGRPCLRWRLRASSV